MKANEQILFTHNNEQIIQYTIENNNGLRVEILNYGGIIKGIYTPDKYGKYENIVVGFKDIEDYIENKSYFGAIIGRTAGRIYKSEFTLNGILYKLTKNYGINQGHGGNVGFNKKVWQSKLIENDTSISLKISLDSYDMEEGYPGNVDVNVIYTLNNNNELNIRYEGVSDKDTLLNMTNHTYFNLSGNLKSPITNQYMKLKSDYILEVDKTCATTGNKISVKNSPFDFRSIYNIGDRIDDNHNQINIGCGYDHPFLLNSNEDSIYIEDRESKRCMSIDTNQNCVVIYSMNFTNNEILYTGNISTRRYGICFETQKPPIGHNQVFLKDSLLKKNQKYTQNTTYKFGMID